jgi:hypothetical protein
VSSGAELTTALRSTAVGGTRPEQAEAGGITQCRRFAYSRIGQHVLEHEGVDVDQRGLQHPQAGDGEFPLVAAVGGQLAALAVQDDLLAAVVGLQHVETLVDLPLQVPVAQVAAGEDGLLGAADLQHRLVGRVGRRSGEAAQDRLGGGGPDPDGGPVADHHVVLLADQAPPDRPGQRRPKPRVGAGFAGGGPVQPHRVIRLILGSRSNPSSRVMPNPISDWPWEST